MKKTLFLISLVFLSLQKVDAQGFQVNFQGQKQQAMGCAGSAKYLDGSAMFFNPGAAAFATENSINLATTPIFARVMYVDSATQQPYRTNSPVGTPFSAYGLFGLKKLEQLKFGIAAYTPFGSTVSYEEGWIGRFALTRLQLKAIFIQPTVSYKINEKLGVGAGFVLSTGDVVLQKDIPVQFEDGTFASAKLSGKALGFGYNLGVSYKATDKLTLGLNYRSQVNMDLNDGNAEFTVPDGLRDKFPNGKFVGSLPLPQVATLGIAYDISDKWETVLDVNFVGWKAYDTLAFDYETNTESLTDTKSARNYKNIFAFRAGAAYKISDVFSLRFGGGYGFSPVQSGFVTPETPDANRGYGTFGISYSPGKHFSLDASFYYTQVKRSDINQETNLSGTFSTKAVAPGLALIYKW
ncbi:MAG: hypothetical protein RL264_913 [Bacteroidota bacterium]|jgi:long-chain fatty acid transport protein